jgi:hypothetical protein
MEKSSAIFLSNKKIQGRIDIPTDQLNNDVDFKLDGSNKSTMGNDPNFRQFSCFALKKKH